MENCNHEFGQVVESFEDLRVNDSFLVMGGQKRPYIAECEFSGGLNFSEDEIRELIRAGYVWRFPILRVQAAIRSDLTTAVLGALRSVGVGAVEVFILASDNPGMEGEEADQLPD